VTNPDHQQGDGRGQPESVTRGTSESVTHGKSAIAEPEVGPAREAGAAAAAGTGHAAAPGLAASPALQGLAALMIYLAIWVLAEVLPLVTHPGQPQLYQPSEDPNFYTWCLRWWPYAIAHGLNPLYSTQVDVPAGVSLAWSTSVPPLALLAFPLTALAGSIVSFSLLVVAAIPVSGWAAFVLCRRLTQRFWPALAGGAVYGFSAYEMNHIFAGQLNLAFSLLLPLMAYLVVLWRDGRIGSNAFVGLLALSMVLQFYLFIETFMDMTAVWVIALAVGYLLAGRPDRPVIASLSRLAGVAYALAIVCALPYLAYALAHVPAGFVRSPAVSSLDLAGLVIPRAGQTFGLSWLAHATAPLPVPGKDGYLGVPLVALAVAAAITTWRRKSTRFLTVMLVVLILAALGPVVHVDGHAVIRVPWERLWFLPIVRSAYPARFMVFAFLALAVMMALWLAGPSRLAWSRWLLAVLAVAAIGANVPKLDLQSSPGLPAFIATGEYRHYLAPGDTVVVIAPAVGNEGLLWQAKTDFYLRLAGGFVNAAIGEGDVPRQVAALENGPLTNAHIRRFRAFLKEARISAILVRADMAQRWPLILREVGLRGQATGGVILYRTSA
jgi:hypothetical protein